MRYQVTWGDESKTVEAATENDAWAVFADDHDLAKRYPKLHAREVVEAPAPAPKAPVKSSKKSGW